jgi:catechol 2,3-dioxygenase-like lactoylglutathione lyase family enzyme
MSGFEIEGFDHVAIAVRDLAASRDWYARVLGMERQFENDWGEVPSVMCVSGSCVALFPVEGAGLPGPGRDALVMRHFAWRVDRANFERAQRHFEDIGVMFEFEDHGASHSVYISDPDGHLIEITTYEI